MRVVLDTNVIVSAALTEHGMCARIVETLAGGIFDLCADDRVLGEYDAVLRRPEFRIAPANVDALMELIRHIALPVSTTPLAVQLPDPDDHPFLEVAAAAAAILVTGNRRHFPKKACGDVKVLSPRTVVEMLRRVS